MKVNRIKDARQLKPGAVLLVPGASRKRRVPVRKASRSTSSREPADEPPKRRSESSNLPRIEPSEPSGDLPTTRNFRPVWPCRGRVASRFRGNNPAQRGIRIHASEGSSVRAVEEGNVKLAGTWEDLPQLGNLVIILHPEDFASVYAHLGSLTVNEGDHVGSGEKIGEVGSSGDVRQPTCYFELRYKGKARDPILFLGEPT